MENGTPVLNRKCIQGAAGWLVLLRHLVHGRAPYSVLVVPGSLAGNHKIGSSNGQKWERLSWPGWQRLITSGPDYKWPSALLSCTWRFFHQLMSVQSCLRTAVWWEAATRISCFEKSTAEAVKMSADQIYLHISNWVEKRGKKLKEEIHSELQKHHGKVESAF